MLFSATMPGDVVTLARRHMRQPTNPGRGPRRARARAEDAAARVPGPPDGQDRGAGPGAAGQGSRPDHGVLPDQAGRRPGRDRAGQPGLRGGHGPRRPGPGPAERALRAFRSGKVDVLTATEVAARGLDVDDVTHVVNYECPDDEKTYVHRIGRTGRAGQAGVAVTFVDWRDMHRWKLINDALSLASPSRRRRTPPPTTSTPSWTSRARRPGRCPARCGTGPGSRPRPSRTSARPARSARQAARSRPRAPRRAAPAGRGRARRRHRPAGGAAGQGAAGPGRQELGAGPTRDLPGTGDGSAAGRRPAATAPGGGRDRRGTRPAAADHRAAEIRRKAS